MERDFEPKKKSVHLDEQIRHAVILIAVATSIGGVGIPLLTENYVKGDLKAAARLVQDVINAVRTKTNAHAA